MRRGKMTPMGARVALAAFALSATACGDEPSVNERNASVDEVAAKVREATGGVQFIRAGEWKSTTTIEEMSVPGMSTEESARLRQAMGGRATHESTTCLSEEEVKQPKGKFFTGNDQCRYDRFVMQGGKIDAKMRCNAQTGESQVMTMTGTYSPESYRMQMDLQGAAPEGPAGMRMRMRVESNRIGDCNAKAADAAP